MRSRRALSNSLTERLGLCRGMVTPASSAEDAAGVRGWPSETGSFGGAANARGNVTVKVLPWPKTLCALMSPPILRARLRDISNPSPVPPKRRDVLASPWAKRSKSFVRVA